MKEKIDNVQLYALSKEELVDMVIVRNEAIEDLETMLYAYMDDYGVDFDKIVVR